MALSGEEAERLVRDILRQHGKLGGAVPGIAADADLYRLGLSSLATVNVMMEIETRLDAAFPEDALNRESFRTIAALSALVSGMSAQAIP